MIYLITFFVLLTSTSTLSLVRQSTNPAISIVHNVHTGYRNAGDGIEKNQPDKIACKDEDGHFVDWFIVYKLPKIASSQEEHSHEGSAHYYLLPDSSLWTKSKLAIDDSQSLVGKTVEPLNTLNQNNVKKLNQEFAVVLYNDQPPDMEPTIKNGHTKGMIIANSLGGFWMSHSVPHFPKINKTFDYPPGGLENGQLFMCMSLPLVTLDTVVGGLLQYTKATFYNSSISPTLQKSLSKLQNVLTNNVTVTQPPWYNKFQFTAGRLDLTVFAKGPKFRREIYADWIAPTFNTNLDVQSWLNGAHPFMSNCTSNCSVYNVLEKQMLGQNFSYSDDHSKWSVGLDKIPLTCIADLNRMKPQKSRGGVAICMKDIKIWSVFKSLIVTTQLCQPTGYRSWIRHGQVWQHPLSHSKKKKHWFSASHV